MACMISQNQNIKRGTTLIEAKPFAFLLCAELREKRCDYCFKSCKVSRCSGCQYVHYCSRNCQKLSWNIHKVECSNIKRVYPKIAPDAARMMARIIIKLNAGGGSERGYYLPSQYRTFNDMMSHESLIMNDPMKMEHFTNLYMVLKEFLPEHLLPNCKNLIQIFGRMAINSFHILDSDMTSIGVGIYLGPSIINHSCKPNALAVFQGTTIIIKSLNDLPALDWSKITVTYIDLIQNTKSRREELAKSYYFYCECERCEISDIKEIAAACQNINCSNACLRTDTSCSKCGEIFSNNFKERYDIACYSFGNNLKKMASNADLEIASQCLKNHGGVLHPFNILVMRMLDVALAASMDLSQCEEAEKYLSQLVPLYTYYYGEIHPLTGRMYYVWAKVLSLMNKLKEALEISKKSAEIIKLWSVNHEK